MKLSPKVHYRKSIRLKHYDYRQPGAYFITLVTQDHANLFGKIIDGEMKPDDIGLVAIEVWQHLTDHFPIRLDEWILMPNHLHGIIWIMETRRGEAFSPGNASPLHHPIGTLSRSLGAIIQNFKSVSTRKINQWRRYSLIDKLPYPADITKRIWQRKLDQIRLYIIDNPLKWTEDKEFRA